MACADLTNWSIASVSDRIRGRSLGRRSINRHEAIRLSRNAYWGSVLALVAFGIVAILSIGFVFLALGIALAALSPYRSSPRIFRTGMALVVGFLFGYLIVAPWSCTASVGFGSASGATTSESCRSLLGIEYSDPSPIPGLIAGGAIALLGATLAFATTDRSGHR